MPKRSLPCPRCKAPMQRLYIRGVLDGKRSYLPVGWLCSNINCQAIERDL